ncbi:MAG: hypothetical protein FWG63_08435 [Defluviitaleaceae bacterium]|nr:hypothetical protein [Defluviitaleaceae bacterium]
MNIIDIRDNVLNFARKYEMILAFGLKFIAGLIIYSTINNIGHYNQAFALIANLGLLFSIFMGILFAILPLNANYLIMVLFTTIQFTNQLEIAFIVFLGLLTTFLFYGHFGKKENVLIIALIMGFNFNMPFIVPIIAGLYFGLTSIIPLSIGAFIWSYGQMILGFIDYGYEEAEEAAALLDIEIDDLLATIMEIYQSFVTGGDAIQNWLVVTIAMFAPFIFVYIISRLSINYAKELSIILGTVLGVSTFIFASFFVDLGFGIVSILIFAVLGGLLLYLYNFFNVALDYRHAQRVEFQDEEYYYYVKLIPKKRPVVSHKKSNIKQQVRQQQEDRANIYEEYEREYEKPDTLKRPQKQDIPERLPRQRGSQRLAIDSQSTQTQRGSRSSPRRD